MRKKAQNQSEYWQKTAKRKGKPAELKDPITGMEFVYVDSGCYQMGDTFGDDKSDEKPVHEVCVDDFYIGKYEVTQGQWKAIMGDNPSKFDDCGDNCPVEKVSWNDAQAFIQKLNQQTGKNYRLPTEAEWEYAARSGGKNEKYSGGNDLDSVAWYDSNSGKKTHPVGTKQPNGLGIYDMSGNVWEWVNDWYGSYSSGSQNNPKGASSGSLRVQRGGSWDSVVAWGVRASNRFSYTPDLRFFGIGFRLAGPK
jgi:formylglycine-generating enzyme required for sulfatase activity